MDVFSKRNNLSLDKEIQLNKIDNALFNRIWNIFYNNEYQVDDWILGYDTEKPEKILDSFGCTYKYPKNFIARNENINKLYNYLLKAEWYVTYDFIEQYVKLFETAAQRKNIEKELNIVLEEEKSGYRMVKGLITPITNPGELESIKESMTSPYKSVNTHFEKALSLYSKRKNPDYENSIKESISAVEAMCCIITGMSGKGATLGEALKKLEEYGIHIHKAMQSGFSALYGYTSDENGIRHGGIDFTGATAEDAKYMLVSCSAFVNYLIEKWEKNNMEG